MKLEPRFGSQQQNWSNVKLFNLKYLISNITDKCRIKIVNTLYFIYHMVSYPVI